MNSVAAKRFPFTAPNASAVRRRGADGLVNGRFNLLGRNPPRLGLALIDD